MFAAPPQWQTFLWESSHRSIPQNIHASTFKCLILQCVPRATRSISATNCTPKAPYVIHTKLAHPQMDQRVFHLAFNFGNMFKMSTIKQTKCIQRCVPWREEDTMRYNYFSMIPPLISCLWLHFSSECVEVNINHPCEITFLHECALWSKGTWS